MTITVSSLVPDRFQWWATLSAGDQVIGAMLVSGRTRAQALKAARAIAARISPEQLSLVLSS